MINIYNKANESANTCLKNGDLRMARIWLEICGNIISAMQDGENENSFRVKYLLNYIENLENGVVL